ncbi:hypothetical protein [Actinopolymorpha sp. B9G3]|uniref:hypothetical protein n=1 Tax=Actinopolymorpha sp. B9G3 TaxID=3158970 RepID=UPI0032D922FF
MAEPTGAPNVILIVSDEPFHPWVRCGRRCQESADLGGGERVGSSAEQLAGFQVVEHQRGCLDAYANPAAGEDFGGEDLSAAQRDDAHAGDDPFDLYRAAFAFGWSQWGGSGVDGAFGHEPGQVVDGEVGADGLDPRTGNEQVDQVDVGPEPDDHAGPDRPEPELPAGDLQVPTRWHHPVELDRTTRPAVPASTPVQARDQPVRGQRPVGPGRVSAVSTA